VRCGGQQGAGSRIERAPAWRLRGSARVTSRDEVKPRANAWCRKCSPCQPQSQSSKRLSCCRNHHLRRRLARTHTNTASASRLLYLTPTGRTTRPQLGSVGVLAFVASATAADPAQLSRCVRAACVHSGCAFQGVLPSMWQLQHHPAASGLQAEQQHNCALPPGSVGVPPTPFAAVCVACAQALLALPPPPPPAAAD
jgi:hypothetical protein